MGRFRLAALIGGALVAGILIGLLGAGRSRTTATTPIPPPSIAGDILRSGKPHVPPKLPAPKLPAYAAEPAPVGNALQPFLKQLLDGGMTNKIGRKQLEAYLRENRRNAASLLATARITGDRDLLREARQRSPNDPRVLMDWMLRSDATPAERRQALDAFLRAAPDNALGDYLSALDHFENGQADLAVQAMWGALNKTRLDDYFLETEQDCEEAYVAAGYSPAQAAAAAYYGMELRHMVRLRALSRSLLDLQQQYTKAGEAESAQVVAEMGIQLGSQLQLQTGNLLIGDLVGMAIERPFLERLDPGAVLASSGQTLAARLQELDQRKKTIRELVPCADILSTLDEREVNNFIARAKLYGELEALQWLQDKHGNAQP